MVHGFLRFGAKLVSQRYGPENATVASNENDRFAHTIMIANFGKRIRWNGHAMLFKQCPRADHDARPRFLDEDSFAWRVTQLRILTQRQVALSRAAHDRFAKRMLGMLLGDGSGLEHVILCRVVDRSHRRHFGNSEREGAGFVQNDSVDAAELLEVKPTLRDNAATRSASDSREDGEWRTGCYAAPASEDDHRDSRSEMRGDNNGEPRGPKDKVNQ